MKLLEMFQCHQKYHTPVDEESNPLWGALRVLPHTHPNTVSGIYNQPGHRRQERNRWQDSSDE